MLKNIFIFALILIFIKLRFFNWWKIKRIFKANSIVVCGTRGSGKDTLMSAVSWRTKHNSNIPLHKYTNVIMLKDIMLPDYVDRRLLTKQIKLNIPLRPIDKQLENDTYISDSQIYFPNWDDNNLKKDYPSLPITYSLWRQLYGSGLHFNTQNVNRLYKILREQIEDCIMCLGCFWMPFFCVMKVRYYERVEDCVNGLKPVKIGFLRRGNPDYRIELSHRWEIWERWILIPRYKINHDTRYFRSLIFNVEENL